MSCNGCRALRKDCSTNCIIRPCLQWIKSPESQAHATIFLAKFYGRAALVTRIRDCPEHLRPATFRSLLYEACGRTVNPIHGSVGFLWSGSWQLCQAAVEAVLKGAPITPINTGAAAAEGYGQMSNFRAFVDRVKTPVKRALAILFILLETISFSLAQFGGSHLSFLLASFVLSAFGFLITIYTCIINRRVTAGQRSKAEKQLIVVEFVFSFVQLIVTYIDLVRTILGAKRNNIESLLPFAFAVVSLVFVFKNDEDDQIHSSLLNILVDSSNTPSLVDGSVSSSHSNQIQRQPSTLRQRTATAQADQLHNIEDDLSQDAHMEQQLTHFSAEEESSTMSGSVSTFPMALV